MSTNKLMATTELGTWIRANFTGIFSHIIGDAKLDERTLMELTSLASVVLLDKSLG